MNTILKNMIAALLVLTGFSFAIDITSCGVISKPGEYYVQSPGISTLGTSLQDCLTVQSDNVIIYCQGHYVRAPADPSNKSSYPGYAIYVRSGYKNIVVTGCVLEDSLSGLRVGDGTGNSNIVASYNIARNNVFNGFEILGVRNSNFYKNTFECSSKISSGAPTAGFSATNLSSSTIRNSSSTNCDVGFYLALSSQNSLRGNSATGALNAGLMLTDDSDDNIVENFTSRGNRVGLSIVGFTGFLGGSPDFPVGSSKGAPDRNIFTGCTASEDSIGFSAMYGTGNSLFNSTITSSSFYAASLINNVEDFTMEGNYFSGNSHTGLSSIIVSDSKRVYVRNNVIEGSPNGIGLSNISGPSVVGGNRIIGANRALVVQNCEDTSFPDNVIEGGVVMLGGNSRGSSFTNLLFVGAPSNAMLDIPSYAGEYDISLSASPAPPPTGMAAANKYFRIIQNSGTGKFGNSGTGSMQLVLHYEDAELGTLNESQLAVLVWGTSWSMPTQALDTAANRITITNPSFGTFGLFSGIFNTIPPTPPPSGGGSSGSSSGSSPSRGSGGAVHIGIPYVPSGSGNTTSSGSASGSTTSSSSAVPSCTSNADCSSSEECSRGRCVSLIAGSSCGTFRNHEWVNYECCGTEDCGAGEVCRENVCVPMEALLITAPEPRTTSETAASDEGLGRFLGDIPWWVLLLLLLVVGGGIYAYYKIGGKEESSEEEMPPTGEEEE